MVMTFESTIDVYVTFTSVLAFVVLGLLAYRYAVGEFWVRVLEYRFMSLALVVMDSIILFEGDFFKGDLAGHVTNTFYVSYVLWILIGLVGVYASVVKVYGDGIASEKDVVRGLGE